MTTKFKIGEFARIAQISAKILRHYDEIELFKPAYTDTQNNYRYYTLDQLETLNRIIIFKELGFSLSQVKTLLSDDLPLTKLQGMLTLREAQIEQAIEDDLRRLAHIRSRLHHLEMAGTLHQEIDVVVKPIPAQPILSIHQRVRNFDEAVLLFHEFAHEFLPTLKLNQMPPLIALSHTPDDDFNATAPFEFELGLVVNNQQDLATTALVFREQILRLRELPEVDQMATFTQVGPSAHLVTGGFGEWLDENQYEMQGAWREIYHYSAQDTPVFIIEHQVPVFPTGGE